MRNLTCVALSVAGLLLSAPAWASYVDVTYSGTVDQVGPGGPASVTVGTPITFNVVFDTARLVDYTASVDAVIPPAAAFSSEKTASLSDDPFASLTITVGSITFTKFDGVNYGTPCGDTPISSCSNPTSPTGGLGAGNLPAAEYLDGSFAGVANIFINSQGYTLDADPVADAVLRASRGRAFRVYAPGDFDFVLSMGDAANPFAQEFAAGDINISSIQISAIPEPSAWALLLAGVAPMIGIRTLGRPRESLRA